MTKMAALEGHFFLKFLIRQLEAIKFAVDWHARESHVGGKKYKQCFIQRLFDTVPVHQPLQSNGSPEQRKLYNRTLRSFKAQHRKSVTAHNYLLQLYQQV
jgi:hypothetical protein